MTRIRGRVHIIAILLMLNLGVGCSGEWFDDIEPTVQFTADTLASYTLQGQALQDADSLASPGEIVVGKKYILVGDSEASRPLLVFDKETGALITSGGAFGEGPREIKRASSLDFKPGHDTGWVFDYTPRSLHYVDLDSLVLTQSITEKWIQLDVTGVPLSPVWTGEDSIVSPGFYLSGKLAVYSADGTFHRLTGPTPPGLVSTPVPVRQHAYRSVLRTTSDGNRIAAASMYTDRIEIYDRGELLHLIRGPGFHEPDYTVYHDDQGNSWLGMAPESINGYIGLTVTDQLIFALYSGRPYELGHSAEDIIVFTWDGQPLAILHLGGEALEELKEIAVSADGRDLYAIFHSPTPLIMHYPLPALSGT